MIAEQISKLLKGTAAQSTITKRIPMLLRTGEALDSDNLDWINDIKSVKEFLLEKSLGTRCNYLSSIISLGKAMHINPSILGVYERLSDIWNEERHQIRANNVSTPRNESYLSVGLNELQSRVKQFNPESLVEIQKRAIVACYLLMPALRNDFSSLKITELLRGLRDDQNYLYTKGKVMRIILNNYKTAAKYGKQIISIDNPDLKSILNQWIISARKYAISKKQSKPEYLFYFKIASNGLSHLSPISLQAALPDISQTIIGLPMGINDYRKLWENAIQSDPEYQKLTNAQQEAIHIKMLHSGSTARLDYKKV